MERGDTLKQPGRPKAGDLPFWEKDGSPTKACLQLVEACAGMGLPKYEIATLVGLARDTFYDRAKMFPSVYEAYEFGEANVGMLVANALVKKAKSGDMHAIRWYEMTRKNRAEKTESTVTETQYVVEAPAAMEQEAWEAAFAPEKGVNGTGP